MAKDNPPVPQIAREKASPAKEEEKEVYQLIATVNGIEYLRNMETGNIVRRQQGRP